MPLKKGVFTISIDYESAWGYADYFLSEEDKIRIRNEGEITKKLIALFEKYNIPATWAVVGHLFEKGDNDSSDSLWYDQDQLIAKISASKTGHEIGSHSYSHILYGDKKNSDSEIENDLKNIRRVQKDSLSFVFPRNFEGRHDLIYKYGFKIFRGNTKHWYNFMPNILQRLVHFLDYFIPVSPVVKPEKHKSGPLNIPDSMLLIGRNGFRCLIPPALLIAKAKYGISKAIKKHAVFHLWFHPSNFSYETQKQFSILESILAFTAQKRDEKKIDILTLAQIFEKITL